MAKQENYDNYNPIYQNTDLNRTKDTTPIYSNTTTTSTTTMNDPYNQQSNQGMTYGESLAHNLRHSLGKIDNNTQQQQGKCDKFANVFPIHTMFRLKATNRRNYPYHQVGRSITRYEVENITSIITRKRHIGRIL